MSSIRNIMPEPTGGLTECLELFPGAELSFLGNCHLILRKGSFEMKYDENKPLEIQCRGYPCGEYFHDLERTKKFVCFIQANFFVLKAGNLGCAFDLYYPPVEKKDWGIEGPELRH